jgi:hypothetical protein
MQTDTSRVTTDRNKGPAGSAAPKPKLLNQVRQAIRSRHYSKRTEKTYAEWINPFFIFHLQFFICHRRKYFGSQ